MGRIVHAYRNPNADWDGTDEESPRIRAGAVVGANAIIIGQITIGLRSYIAAGEIVRKNVPADTVIYRGKSYPIKRWKGRLRLRRNGNPRQTTHS